MSWYEIRLCSNDNQQSLLNLLLEYQLMIFFTFKLENFLTLACWSVRLQLRNLKNVYTFS